jgi:hypothetical protein
LIWHEFITQLDCTSVITKIIQGKATAHSNLCSSFDVSRYLLYLVYFYPYDPNYDVRVQKGVSKYV